MGRKNKKTMEEKTMEEKTMEEDPMEEKGKNQSNQQVQQQVRSLNNMEKKLFPSVEKIRSQVAPPDSSSHQSDSNQHSNKHSNKQNNQNEAVKQPEPQVAKNQTQ